MALNKAIRQEDGVTTSYHRISYIHNTINRQSSIAVLSYVDKEAREDEIKNNSQPYRQSKTYETTYDEGITPEKAYEYLKTLPDFEGAVDV